MSAGVRFGVHFLVTVYIVINVISNKSNAECTGASCYPELYSNLFQGDILLTEEDDFRNAIAMKSNLWPGGKIPYIFSSSFNPKDKEQILKAMKSLESKTCVLFTPKSLLDMTFLHINQNKGGCYANIGYRPLPFIGPLKMNLETPGCYHDGTIQHELLHVLGLFHEQARVDRDEFVDIKWENIDKKHYYDFSKVDSSFVTDYNVTYDYKSIMHYPKTAFSTNGKATIVAKNDTELDLGQRDGPTKGDLLKIKKMYNCP